MKRSTQSRHLLNKLDKITNSNDFESTQIGVMYDVDAYDIECITPITAAIKSVYRTTIEDIDILTIEYDTDAVSGMSIDDFRRSLLENIELPVYVHHKNHYHPVDSICQDYNTKNEKLIIIYFEWNYEEPEPVLIAQSGDYMLVVNFSHEGHIYTSDRYICETFDAAFLHMKKLYDNMRLEEGGDEFADRHFPPIEDYVNYWETEHRDPIEFIIYDLRTAQLATPPKDKI